MSTQHRRDPRAPLEVEVSLESDNNFYAGITGNVSQGGLFIATYTPPPMDSIVALDLRIEGKVFRLRGLVCWVREPSRATEHAPAGCGLQWVALPTPALEVIDRFVKKRETLFHDDED